MFRQNLSRKAKKTRVERASLAFEELESRAMLAGLPTLPLLGGIESGRPHAADEAPRHAHPQDVFTQSHNRGSGANQPRPQSHQHPPQHIDPPRPALIDTPPASPPAQQSELSRPIVIDARPAASPVGLTENALPSTPQAEGEATLNSPAVTPTQSAADFRVASITAAPARASLENAPEGVIGGWRETSLSFTQREERGLSSFGAEETVEDLRRRDLHDSVFSASTVAAYFSSRWESLVNVEGSLELLIGPSILAKPSESNDLDEAPAAGSTAENDNFDVASAADDPRLDQLRQMDESAEGTTVAEGATPNATQPVTDCQPTRKGIVELFHAGNPLQGPVDAAASNGELLEGSPLRIEGADARYRAFEIGISPAEVEPPAIVRQASQTTP